MPGKDELSLAHLELRVFLANDVHAPFAAYDFAVFAAFFDGCSDFHRFELFDSAVPAGAGPAKLLVPERNPAFAQVIRRHFDLYFVPGQNLDVVHPHLSGDVGGNYVAVVQFHAEHGVGQSFDNGAVLFDCSLFSHSVLVC